MHGYIFLLNFWRIHSYKNTIDKDFYDLTKMYTLESSIIHLIMFNSSNKAKIILSVI